MSWTTDRERFNFCKEQFKESEKFCKDIRGLVFADGVSVNYKSQEAWDNKQFARTYVDEYVPVCRYKAERDVR